MKQTLAAFFLVAVLAAAPAISQTDSSSLSGVIVSTNTDSLVVRMDDGSQRTFAVDSTTTVPSVRLAAGNKITVSYRPLDAGRFQAANVVLIEGPETRTADQSVAANDRVQDPGADDTLPRTASNMPGLALLGGMALFMGLALSAVRRRA